MADRSTGAYRFTDVASEPVRRMPPIRGFENLPLVSLEEAVKSLIAYVPEVEHMVNIVKGNSNELKHGLTMDESASITLYSMEWSPRQNSFYVILNKSLGDPDRTASLPPWLKYMKLLLTALSKLPPTGRDTIYRGVKLDLRGHYTKGAKIVWWGFSSCTTTVEALENEDFFGKTGTRTLFSIRCETGKDIRKHSLYQTENEILLIPGREFEVVGSLDMGNNLIMIQLKEIEPQFPNIAPLLPPNLSPIITNTPPATAATSIPKVAAVVTKPSIPPVKLSYKIKRITDADIERVIQEALLQKQCTELDLSWNKITHEGAAILAEVLQKNTVRSFCDSLLLEELI